MGLKFVDKEMQDRFDEMKIRQIDPNSELAKKLLESQKKSEAIREGIRAGKKISEIAKEMGFKFVNPLEEVSRKNKRIKQIIDIACGPWEEEDEDDEEEQEEGTTMPWKNEIRK